jgi:leucine-rich repeat protein SHOC2
LFLKNSLVLDMPKLTHIILPLLMLLQTMVKAQQAKWLVSDDLNSHKSVDYYLNPSNYEALHLPDSIKLLLGNSTDAQRLIDKKIHTRVYAVAVFITHRPDIGAIIRKLRQFPNLQYLSIADSQRGAIDDKPYQIPDSIAALPNLVGIEFAYTSNLNMVDAFNKLASAKNLKQLIINGYYKALPANLTQLKQIEYVNLNTLNICDMDLSSASWKSVYLAEGQQTGINKRFVGNGVDQRALTNLSKVKSLKMLDIGLFRLSDASFLKNMIQLTGLKLYLNKTLRNATENIATLTNLESLSLTIFDDGRKIDLNEIASLSKLKNLALRLTTYGGSKPSVSEMEALRNFKKLESLDLSFNNLGTIPDIFGDMPHLKTLSLMSNGLTLLPESLYNLHELEYLNLMYSRLGELPNKKSYGWHSLKTLILNNNRLTTLPAAILRLPRLENFSATHNGFITIAGSWDKLKFLKTVNLANNALKELPRGLLNNQSLISLNINENKITEMPDVATDNYTLKDLNISNNPITHLPERINRFHNLESLQGYNLKLEHLPQSLGNCIQLKELSLSRSIAAKTTLPVGLANAPHLGVLNLSGCPMLDHESVFEVILSPRTDAINADLSGNNIERLPTSSKWSKANVALLNLSFNKITTIPTEVATAKFATGILLYKNLLSNYESTPAELFKSSGDFKELFDNLKIDHKINAPDSVYALTLIKRIPALSAAKDYTAVINYAEKAKQLDPESYQNNAPWKVIGLCRFITKDYRGALIDFDQYISQQENPEISVRYDTSTELEYMLKADSAIDNPAGMAKTHIRFGGLQHYIKALTICRQINNMTLYKQLSDKALAARKKWMDWFAKEDRYSAHEMTFLSIKDQYRQDDLTQYAGMQLIAGNAANVIETLNLPAGPYHASDKYQSQKNLLLAAAGYLIKPADLEQIKKNLADSIAKNGPIITDQYRFLPFTHWLPASNYTAEQQKHLIDLYQIAQKPLPIVEVKLESMDVKTRMAALFKRFYAAYEKTSNDSTQWKTVVHSADEIRRLDSVTYNQLINGHIIGAARFKTKDYQGAITDFNRSLKQRQSDYFDAVNISKFKVKAHLALGQILKAAKTFEELGMNYGPKTYGLQEAAVLYQAAGNGAKFKNLINQALKQSKKSLDSAIFDQNNNRASHVLDYAELLIVAGKKNRAEKLLKKENDKEYMYTQTGIKSYLLAAIDVLNGTTLPDKLKAQTTEFMRSNSQIYMWDFTMFNRWIKSGGIDKAKQNELLALQGSGEQNLIK